MIQGYICNFRRRVVRVSAQTACRATPKVANISGTSVALEGMPTDGLLAGTVCLSPALAGSLRDVDVEHVVGNMEDEGQRDWILYSISLPRASCFLVVPP